MIQNINPLFINTLFFSIALERDSNSIIVKQKQYNLFIHKQHNFKDSQQNNLHYIISHIGYNNNKKKRSNENKDYLYSRF